MTFSNISRALFACSLAGLVTIGCAAPVDGDTAGAEDTEEGVGTVSQALTDPCATGSTANFKGYIAGSGTAGYASYTRGSAWINPGPICGQNARDTTIVDFVPHPDESLWYYSFNVDPVWGSVSLADCAKSKLVVKVYATNKTTGAYEWVGGTGTAENKDRPLVGKIVGAPFNIRCELPKTETWDRNLASSAIGDVQTHRYRVRTIAYKADGTFATVKVSGQNEGG